VSGAVHVLGEAGDDRITLDYPLAAGSLVAMAGRRQQRTWRLISPLPAIRWLLAASSSTSPARLHAIRPFRLPAAGYRRRDDSVQVLNTIPATRY